MIYLFLFSITLTESTSDFSFLPADLEITDASIFQKCSIRERHSLVNICLNVIICVGFVRSSVNHWLYMGMFGSMHWYKYHICFLHSSFDTYMLKGLRLICATACIPFQHREIILKLRFLSNAAETVNNHTTAIPSTLTSGVTSHVSSSSSMATTKPSSVPTQTEQVMGKTFTDFQ